MAKFNFYDYDTSYVTHCPTYESAEVFLDIVNPILRQNYRGDYPKEDVATYRSTRCYRFVRGTRDYIDFYRGEGCKILEFDDFDWTSEDIDPAMLMTFDEFMSGL